MVVQIDTIFFPNAGAQGFFPAAKIVVMKITEVKVRTDARPFIAQ